MKTIILALLGLSLLIGCVPAVSADAGTMAVYVSDTGGAYGTTVDIPINVSGALNVGAMDISVMYDSTKLSPTGIVTTGVVTASALVITDATIYGVPGTISEADNLTLMQHGALASNTAATDGVVNISIVCDGNNPPVGFNGAGPVAVVEFTVTGTGSSQLDLSVAAYNVSAPYNDSGYIPDTVNITDGYEAITVTATNATFEAGPGEEATHTISLNEGWNMVSIPVIPANATVSAIFGDNITPPVYEYAAGYNSVTSLEPKKGYWVLANSAVDVSITGTVPSNREVTLVAGWNMIGPVSSGTTVSSFTGITSPVYGYDAGYNPATIVEPTKGYWVLASAETTLTI